ncbi:MAG: glycoside hydrolase family 44 protein [Verrucomicrobia bacterium]|nr:glycoside hydrolase family 44 protein [Verrucomicrobiota bacterium]
MNSSAYSGVSFWLNGGASGGQSLQVYGNLHIGGNAVVAQSPRYFLATLAANTWQQFTVPLSALGVAGHTNFTGFVIQDRTGSAQPVFYVDDVSLVATNVPSSFNITVDAQAGRHAISPLIYGTAFATSNQLSALNFTLNRSGGNNETRYNWLINAHNLDADYYFESYPESDPTPGGAADDHIANSKAGGAQPMITIPMIGWSPKLGAGRSILPSYSVAKYGPQKSTDPYLPDAGNGLTTAGVAITNNDPNDANFPTNSAFQQGYVRHLITRWGASTNGGVRYYFMDNEHSLWSSTHQDIHPVGPTMQEIWGKMLDYATMVKSNDPDALVAGPEEWGWPGYFFSGYDQQWANSSGDYNSSHYPDRQANAGWDYMPWLLNKFYQQNINSHQRLLDCFTVHCYPQESGVGGNAVDSATELLRNASTRQFWDPSYVDPSWINDVIMLIPRMKGWVASYYPGTKIGITEYNWGAEASISGATAQADILGIFGREGLDLATRWTTPATNTPTFLAMKMYRNYDGARSTFGDTSVSTTVPNPDSMAAFGAIRTNDGALTLMVINKDINNATAVDASITNFNSIGVAQRWQLTAANVISHLSNLAFTNSVLTDSVPVQSITLYVLPALAPFSWQVKSTNLPGQLNLQLNGQAGVTYAFQSSTDLVHWSAFTTNTLTSNSLPMSISTTNSTKKFYRSVWLP